MAPTTVISVGATTAEIAIADPGLERVFRYATSSVATDAVAEHTCLIERSEVGFTLRIDGDEAYSASDGSNVVDHLVAWCNRVAVESRLGSINLHAAGVVPVGGEGAVVIPGSPGAGKSTLAASACRLGWGYLSDELVSVTAEGRLLTYPKPLTIKSGTIGTLPADLVEPATVSDRQSRWYLGAADLGGWVATPTPPHAIIFAVYDDVDPTDPTPVGVGAATLDLAVNCQHQLDPDGQALHALARMADACVRLRVRHRDIDAGVHALEIAAAERPNPTGAVAPLPTVPIAGDRGPRTVEGVVGVAAHDGVVVHRPDTDAIALLDPIAGVIWQLLDGASDRSDLASELAQVFDHPVAEIERDLAALVDELTDHGFVTEA